MNYGNVKASRRLVTRRLVTHTGYITEYSILYVFPRDFTAWGSSRRQSRTKMRQMIREERERDGNITD